MDNDTLLTGVVHLGDFNTAIRNMETIVYNVDTGTISVLRTENIRNWTPNPHYSEIAFESVSSYDISSYNPTNTSTEIATFDPQTNTLVSTFSRDNGCDLSWSHNGETLAIVEHINPSTCEDGIRTVIFVDRFSGLQQTYTVPQPLRDNLGLGLLGWVQTQAQSTLLSAKAA